MVTEQPSVMWGTCSELFLLPVGLGGTEVDVENNKKVVTPSTTTGGDKKSSKHFMAPRLADEI